MSFSLSFSDLALLDSWKKAFSVNDKEALDKILYENGMDTKEPYEVRYCQHRNLQNKIVTCERYEGTERTDKAFLQSGAASMDAWVRSTNDISLRREMLGMSREANRSDFSSMKSEGGRAAVNKSKKSGGAV